MDVVSRTLLTESDCDGLGSIVGQPARFVRREVDPRAKFVPAAVGLGQCPPESILSRRFEDRHQGKPSPLHTPHFSAVSNTEIHVETLTKVNLNARLSAIALKLL